MAEILLFDSVFHDGVTSVSVEILKPLLGVIGAILLKLQASPIVVKIVDGGLYFIFSFHFHFTLLFFSFSIFRTAQVRVYQSRCHISHKLMA